MLLLRALTFPILVSQDNLISHPNTRLMVHTKQQAIIE